MANNFQIIISAVDCATATVRKVNRSMERLTRPIAQIKRSMGSLSREMGLDKLGRSMMSVGKSAWDVAGKIGSIVSPLAAIAGVGSIAGIAALATEWARLGFEVGRTAATIGISTGTLQSLRGAAQLAGVSSEALTGGLKSLGDTMQDALYGRNQQALVMMNRLGIGIHRTADGTVDTTRAFMDLSRVLSGMHNPQVQGLIARTFGLEESLPLLRQGPAAIEAYQKKIADLGGVQSNAAIEAAAQLGMKMNMLHVAVGGVRNEIGARLAPILMPFIEQLTNWLGKNRELIATRVGEFVESFAHWLEKVDFNKVLNGITEFIKDIKSAVDWMGGWKNAAIALVVVMNGSLIASVVNLGVALGSAAAGGLALFTRGLLLAGTNATSLLGMAGKLGALGGLAGAAGYAVGTGLSWLIDKGLSAVTGSETNLGSWIYDKTHSDQNVPIGIRQNNPLNLRSWAGAGSANGFAQFCSPTEGISAATRNLMDYGNKGINTLSGIINRWAPSGDGNNVNAYIADVSRQTGFSANQPLNMGDSSKVLAPLVSAMIKHENGSNPYSPEMISQAVSAAVSKQQVEVHVHGLPVGTKVTAKTNSGALRVGHSMAPA